MNIPAMPLPTEVANFEDLLGTTIPMEVRSITHLPSHNCLIINDYFLVSFDEAFQLLRLHHSNVRTQIEEDIDTILQSQEKNS